MLSSKCLLIAANWAILSRKHGVCNVVFHLSPQIGTNQIAVCAKAQNKPFYVVAESFKFVRLFPLNQQDVPDRFKYKADTLETGQNLTEEHPWIDYTSPSLITLLFTDLGVLTPSAVSDELIKLYL